MAALQQISGLRVHLIRDSPDWDQRGPQGGIKYQVDTERAAVSLRNAKETEYNPYDWAVKKPRRAELGKEGAYEMVFPYAGGAWNINSMHCSSSDNGAH